MNNLDEPVEGNKKKIDTIKTKYSLWYQNKTTKDPIVSRETRWCNHLGVDNYYVNF